MTRRSGGAPSQRQLRVGEELRHALVRILGRGDLRDPELENVQVTVTEVSVSPDLRSATAFVVPFGGGSSDKLVKALNRAAGFFRAQFSHELKLRYVPGIHFEPDRSFDHASRIEQLLHHPRVASDLGHEAGSEAEDGDDTDDGRGA
ncbi:MAG TPA: 30S ribosome-binding factor RbfA [Candidatus Acidoferrum sp.]|nr:30S ribosome-binding factor RbfA [Candidatus Acidoferrum sp.]